MLVILGLLVGGVLTGADLIKSAALRSQMAQLSSYQGAVNSFRDKFNAIPGDMSASMATRLNFKARSGGIGSGNGNGVIEGFAGYCCNVAAGEGILLWSDLASAGLIEGDYTTGSGTTNPSSFVTSDFDRYYPAAKLGSSNFVVPWSGEKSSGNNWRQNGITSLNIISINVMNTAGYLQTTPNIQVEQLYAIDTKMDDSQPLTGKIVAQYIAYSAVPYWTNIALTENEPPTLAVAASSSTCIDNGNSAGAPFRYSTTFSKNKACSFSIRLIE